MAKFLKIVLIIFLSLAVIAAGLTTAYLIITKDAVLDESKLINPDKTITLYDDNGEEIVNATLAEKRKSVDIDALDKKVTNAFIASEDRKFYSHNGLNYGRMVKAFFKNIKSGAFKEGASTISQQLVKNTHLSSDKTITRKLNEIKLTKKLEKKYSKNQILEMYLNTIYFGHNCNGLQSAAEFYFGKPAEKLNLTEGATLAGLLSSPNNYSPFKNPEKSMQKRNTVLKSMLECGFISSSEYENAKNTPLEAKKTKSSNRYQDYINAVFDQLEETNFDFYRLTEGCKIKTYLNKNLQNYIEELENDCDGATIVISLEGGVSAYKSDIGNTPRQPASTIKPLAVYAPAIEEKILSPFTKILDDKINFGGYSPENFDKKYHGYVSVTESLAKSYNIPAVKALNSLTVEKAEKYLNGMNLKLDDEEKNLSLALGGMKYGLNLKQLSDMYAVFPSGGTYSPSSFIKEIVNSEGKKIYEYRQSKSRVFSEGCCSLMNGMLEETAKNGTAKRLSKLNLSVAAKTGTCGTDDGNTDAYTISYTTDHVVGVWLGDKNNKKLKISGGLQACEKAKKVLEKLYEDSKPENLDDTTGTECVDIDAEEYFTNNKIIVADPLSPKLNLYPVRFLKDNRPKEISTRFSKPEIVFPQISVNNCQVSIKLCQTKYYAYIIKRQFGNETTTIYDGDWQQTILDSPEKGTYIYSVTPYFVNDGRKIYGQEIILPAVNIGGDSSSPQIKIPDIADKNWYDL